MFINTLFSCTTLDEPVYSYYLFLVDSTWSTLQHSVLDTFELSWGDYLMFCNMWILLTGQSRLFWTRFCHVICIELMPLCFLGESRECYRSYGGGGHVACVRPEATMWSVSRFSFTHGQCHLYYSLSKTLSTTQTWRPVCYLHGQKSGSGTVSVGYQYFFIQTYRSYMNVCASFFVKIVHIVKSTTSRVRWVMVLLCYRWWRLKSSVTW